ncbi:class I SAM-dependent methyltransferase [Sphingobacterium sp.]|uniref:class I SAM-dependent methyltransferase n=1 Tax=Sphingobacterium sp. TaxID=341027 RepID=UPI0028A09C48|nr:class I SAM-dependent methyltransferase [Sphingobacterium sp.]
MLKFPSALRFGVANELFSKYDIVGGGRRDCLCPLCRSTDRERLVYLYLNDETDAFSNSHLDILHVAPERNLYKKLMSSDCSSYVVGGLNPIEYNFVKNFVIFDLTDAPFSDQSFDVIICNHVLEHIEDEKSAILEIYRLLKSGGMAILQVPIAQSLSNTLQLENIKEPNDRLAFYGQIDHVRLYGMDYPDRLEKHGLKVSQLNLHEDYQSFGLNKREILYIAHKPS